MDKGGAEGGRAVGRRRVLTPDLLHTYRYLAKDTKAHIEAAIKLLEKKKGK